MRANDIDHVVIDVWSKSGEHKRIDTKNYSEACRWLRLASFE